MRLQTDESRDSLDCDNFHRMKWSNIFMFQDLVEDPQFISETQVFDVVPGKLGMKCILQIECQPPITRLI